MKKDRKTKYNRSLIQIVRPVTFLYSKKSSLPFLTDRSRSNIQSLFCFCYFIHQNIYATFTLPPKPLCLPRNHWRLSVLQHCYAYGLGNLTNTFFRKLANFRNSFQRKLFFQHIRGNALVHFRFFPSFASCFTFFYISVNYIAHIPNTSLRPFFNSCLFITIVVFHYAQQLQHLVNVPHRVSGSYVCASFSFLYKVIRHDTEIALEFCNLLICQPCHFEYVDLRIRNERLQLIRHTYRFI